jgi:hypothetical protein
MARGRMLNRKVAMSRKVADYGDSFGELGGWAVVFHHRLVAFLDKNGNCRADPEWLKSNIMPRAKAVASDHCRRFVAGLYRDGLAVPYMDGDMEYLHMPGFQGEQVGLRREKETTDIPTPIGFDNETGTWPEKFRKESGNDPEVFRKAAGKMSA